MMILKKDGAGLINASHIIKVFVVGTGVIAPISAGTMTLKETLGEYDSHNEAQIAFDIMLEQISNGDEVVKMPTDKEVRARMIGSGASYTFRSATGKKAIRRGGS